MRSWLTKSVKDDEVNFSETRKNQFQKYCVGLVGSHICYTVEDNNSYDASSWQFNFIHIGVRSVMLLWLVQFNVKDTSGVSNFLGHNSYVNKAVICGRDLN